ncbi:MAG: putative enoyl-CoA hydratase [Alphaproteobacteria bacterium MarineAlpha9_Bin3]|nr:MAG: putative enoyl-CoA hydratase [Alphaproteobacteria bacterium MarineAlpha9_Bin3]|tara:strand:- start:1454 stop:2224 length:771 start_codon:yes stop_codon:yes gene_type:complete
MTEDKDLSYFLNKNTGFIKINRPPHNFFDEDLIKRIADYLEILGKEYSCRSIILYSEGKNFCAGADFSRSNFIKGENIYENLYKQALRIFRTSKPIIAIVQGAAIGGGLGLALSADFRITCKEAKFSANFGKLGFHQGFGTSVTLPKTIGDQKAKFMLLTSKRLNGIEAYEIGLADIITNKNLLMKKAIELAEEINTSGPLGIRSIRKTINEGIADEIQKIVKIEAYEQNKLRNTKDFKEGIKASIERREPNFTGK